MSFVHWWRSGDAVTQTAALVLLLMSVASWVIMLWKTRLLSRASADLARSLAATALGRRCCRCVALPHDPLDVGFRVHGFSPLSM